ncbi:type IX secretion system periplasmic lipoprotein PorW/SprE [Mucilaginibacter segetis]|uniref:Tetratricopeptide repeat protein n=1 Tax=Mucilaginibacter segetis TaxID=2793071 RepID=A0A934PVQ2_9SPHI|nr:tetratricopeptide repeat protein [Mucilaginibacter segetis]MBK0380417.1 tetratricopeptide repeat protein [Mucilaginibacter segetis]
MTRALLHLFRKYYYLLLFAIPLMGIAGCSLEKKTKVNRLLQNLTAHYNILFNANQLLQQKQAAYTAAYVDDYNNILPVYTDTAAKTPEPDKDLEEVKAKANKIISIKEQSHYIGDAYLLLGKASYLEQNYFDAAEYFSYVIRSYGDNEDLKQEALVWKARSLLYLNRLEDAKNVLDTALQNIKPKKNITADVYASKLQYDINVSDYTDAEEMAKLAVQYASTKPQELRWTFILAQLQELNGKPADAIENYSRIVKSNASFNMAFNADLNRIRIADNQDGVKISRIDRLRDLLRNQNNDEFTDQIYFQIGELQYAGKDIDKAIDSYNQSVKNSVANQNQKGLSYLRLADIYFNDKADYPTAKNYYDSTLINLSPTYPGYVTIKKKSDNLQVLTNQLSIIAREDTLQQLARLDEATRNARIDEMVNRKTLQQSTAYNALPVINNISPVNQAAQVSTPTGSSFYFYNNKAISQGIIDFKRIWGNRRLEDNWRISSNSGTAQPTNLLNTNQNYDPDALPGEIQRSSGAITATNYRQELLQNLPLTPPLLTQSNLRRYNAYTEIANFYRDVLGDKAGAIAAYQKLLQLFPDDANKPAIYYNLYRLYDENNQALSDKYKNLLVTQYPETPFARIITNPGFAGQTRSDDNELSNLYNNVYDLYAAKKYAQVITAADSLLNKYPDNRFAAQLHYLRAFAAGHNETVDPFNNELQQIVSKYPDDKLITPLVKQHLEYIGINRAELAARDVVLTDNDADTTRFTIPIIYQQQTNYRVPFTGSVTIVPDKRKPEKELLTPPAQANAPKTAQQVIEKNVQQVELTPSIFNMRDSTNYYFVVNVSSGTTNLASSRFGIGQFNRVNFANGTIKHQLKNVGPNNQLIYVGRFYSLETVKDYARAIIPLMPDIMKVPKDKYSFFIITQENLNKLADKITLDSYIDYYQKNYLK